MLEQVKEQFLNNSYKEVPNYKLPKSLLWQPDLIFSKNDFIYFVLVKTNDSIPPSFLDRISKVPKGKVIPLIVFSQRLKNKKDEKYILSLGISIAFFLRGRIVNVTIRKKRSPQIVKQEIKKKLRVIDIFISSKQDVSERKFMEDIINLEREVNYYPFNPPHLIEYDKFNIREIYKRIDQVMSICDWVIILLENNYSQYVRYEINKSIRTKRPENIFLFVKQTNICMITWKKELNKIKRLNSIHYIPYSNNNELEVYLRRAIKTQINKICKRQSIEIFY